MNVGELKKLLKDVDNDRPILNQVVDQEGKAWFVFLTIDAEVNLNWNPNPVIFTLSHPNLKKLLLFDDDGDIK